MSVYFNLKGSTMLSPGTNADFVGRLVSEELGGSYISIAFFSVILVIGNVLPYMNLAGLRSKDVIRWNTDVMLHMIILPNRMLSKHLIKRSAVQTSHTRHNHIFTNYIARSTSPIAPKVALSTAHSETLKMLQDVILWTMKPAFLQRYL